MKPDHSKTVYLSPRHRIEVGVSTWDGNETSVRCRYDQNNGRFSVHGSSEVPLHDFQPMLEVAARHDLLAADACAAIIEVLSASLRRQFAAATRP